MGAIADILAEDTVDEHLVAANKKALFQTLAAASSRRLDLPAKEIAAGLNARERLGSTGFGNGIAIPHGKYDTLGHIHGFFARLAQPIDYGAVDGMPVDLVFMLLSPSDAGADHLKALAAVSRALRDRTLLEKLRGARSPGAIYALLAGAETPNAD